MFERRPVGRGIAGAMALVALSALVAACGRSDGHDLRAGARSTTTTTAAATTTTRAAVEAEAPTTLAAPATTATAGAPAPPPRPLVVVIGESLIVQTRDQLARRLAADGDHAVVLGLDSQQIDSTWTEQQIAWAVAQNAAAVVLESSSNDGVALFDRAQHDGWSAATQAYRSELTTALDRVGSRCAVVVDTRDSPMAAWYHLDKAGPYVNGVIAQAATARPDVEVVAWSALSRPHLSDWFWRDGLHFGDPDRGNADWHPAGAAAFVDAVAAGVGACPGAH